LDEDEAQALVNILFGVYWNGSDEGDLADNLYGGIRDTAGIRYNKSPVEDSVQFA
jgi:hypothetical protein